MKSCQMFAVSSRTVLRAFRHQRLIAAPRVPVLYTSRCPSSTAASSQTIPAPPANGRIDNPSLPTKETLLRVDWMLEHILPGFMKSLMTPFLDMALDDLQFEDKLFNYRFRQSLFSFWLMNTKEQLHRHIAKIRLYYRYMSPHNKVEYVGSCVYEGEDVVVLLWRLSSLESTIWSYLPTFITRKEQKIKVIEGALDVHVTNDGYIYKMQNRKVTASDIEGVKVMSELKRTQGEQLLKEEERAWRKQMREQFDREPFRI